MKNEASTVAAEEPVLQRVRAHRFPVRFTALPTGLRLRHYIVQEAIGAGGFGITYRAEHETLRDKSFALKEFFPRDFAFREGLSVQPTRGGETLCDFGRERFLNEAKVLALCTHPAIVDVVDYFEANGTAYAALEYVPGLHLADWLADLRRPPSQEELDAIVGPLLEAMEVVHSHRLLHRDIAPDNIIVRPDGMPCLIDFGAARSDMGQKAERTAMIVKYGYSPPEQHLGDAERQGRWTDIYAMGATLYRSIAGLPPPDAMKRTSRTAQMTPMPPDVLQRYRPNFIRAIDHALQLEIERRPQTVAQWRTMLMDNSTVTVSRPRASGAASQLEKCHIASDELAPLVEEAKTQIAGKPLERKRTWLLGVGAVCLAGGMALAAYSDLLSHLTGHTSPVEPPLQTPSSKAPAATAGVSIGSVPTSTPTSQPSISANEQEQQQAPGSPSVPETSPPPAQTNQEIAGPTSGARPNTAEVAASSDTATTSTPEVPPSPAPPQSPVGQQPTSGVASTPAPENLSQLSEDCAGSSSERKLAACMALVLALPPGDTLALYRARIELGRALRLRREPDEAIKAYDEAIKLRPADADAYNQRAIAKNDKRDLTGALADVTAAIERNADHGEALNNRAWLLLRLNRAADGLTDANAAVRLLPTRVFVWDTRAQINRQLGNLEAAISDYREALKLNPNHRPSLDGLRALGATP